MYLNTGKNPFRFASLLCGGYYVVLQRMYSEEGKIGRSNAALS